MWGNPCGIPGLGFRHSFSYLHVYLQIFPPCRGKGRCQALCFLSLVPACLRSPILHLLAPPPQAVIRHPCHTEDEIASNQCFQKYSNFSDQHGRKASRKHTRQTNKKKKRQSKKCWHPLVAAMLLGQHTFGLLSNAISICTDCPIPTIEQWVLIWS